MIKIKLHNTLTRKKQIFVPLDENNVRLYLCGPTVYDRAHLGNARNVIMFDVLYRLLIQVYGKKSITYVRNFTDIDDKINNKSLESGRPITDITLETIQWYLDDMAALGNLEPNLMPKATDYIPQMINFIELLITEGFAYVEEGHVLFSVSKYKNYGKLSGRSVEDMIAGARVEIASYKRDPLDFVLWKPSEKKLPGWESPWGRGRPGWHIECSAMAHDILGATFDIHGGGNDLQFPHHENEIAQSKSAFQDEVFVNYWLHNGMVNLSGQKMSKSEGNIKLLNEYINQYGGEAIRFFYLRSHYRKPQEFSESLLLEAKTTLRKLQSLIQEVDSKKSNEEIMETFYECMNDDLNTPKLLGEIFSIIKEISNKSDEEQNTIKETIKYIFQVLGFELNFESDIDKEILLHFFKKYEINFKDMNQSMEEFINLRENYRKNKDFEKADKMRQDIYEIGVNILDGESSEWNWRTS